ncbi:MAG: hypothetical protein IH958_01970 [Chloroflexi bacterium]|nr:hypothetical protein [Chloroflexota bacterium]
MAERTELARWVRSLLWGAAIMALILAIAVPGNFAIGRVIHWEIVTVLGLFGLAAFTLMKRFDKI